MPEIAVLDEFIKAPAAILNYGFDWGSRGWLPAGDTVGDGVVIGTTAPVWTVVDEAATEDPLTLEIQTDSATVEAAGTITSLILTGGTDGVDYLVTCLVTLTPSGLVDERTLRIRCRRR